MDELFPIFSGLLLGVVFATGWPALRSAWIRMLLLLAFGVAATVLSGENKENWGFVFVDFGEVALFAWIGGALVSSLRRVLLNWRRTELFGR